MSNSMNFTSLLICLTLVTGHISPAWAQPTPVASVAEDQAYATKLDQAVKLIGEKKYNPALTLLNEILGYYIENFREEKTIVYSSRHAQETLAYLSEAANSKDEPKLPVKVYSAVWGDAYFLRARIFIEQKSLNQARGALHSAVALGPRNAKYLNELGQLYLSERDWSTALRVLDRAEEATKFSPEAVKTKELTAVWLGKGNALAELRRFDEAETMYRNILNLVPEQPLAMAHLNYLNTAYSKQRQVIAQQKAAAVSLEQLDGKSFDHLWGIAESQNSVEWADSYLRSIGPLADFRIGGVLRVLIAPKDKAIAECVTAIAPAPERARFVFALDQEGVVQRAWADQEGFVSQCVSSKIPGLRLPPPPTSHYLLCTSYERTGEGKSLTTGCGKNHWIESCETLGTTKRCEVKYKRAAD